MKLVHELTAEQTSRQDFVDNEIHALINRLVPEKYIDKENASTLEVDGGSDAYETIPWNIEAIGAVRDAIETAIWEDLAETVQTVWPLPETEEEFSMEFYPCLEDPCDFCWGYGFAWASLIRQGRDNREVQKCDDCALYPDDESARIAASNYNFTDAYKWDQMILEKRKEV